MNGAVAKAKANAAQGLPEMIEISTGRFFRENNEEKHNWNAKMAGIDIIRILHYLYMMITKI